MIWTAELKAAALAVANEKAKPWYAAHIERRLKERAFDMTDWGTGRPMSESMLAEVDALRRVLDPYETRTSHKAFKLAWAEAQSSETSPLRRPIASVM